MSYTGPERRAATDRRQPTDTRPARARRVTRHGEHQCARRGEWHPGRVAGPDYWERGRWAATREEADAEVAEFMAQHPTGMMGHVLWDYTPEQPRTCSYCGGIHPDDAVALVKAGWRVEPTTKGYKRYLAPPEGRPHPVPPVKLYVQHFDAAQVAAFNDALRWRHEGGHA